MENGSVQTPTRSARSWRVWYGLRRRMPDRFTVVFQNYPVDEGGVVVAF